MDSKPKIMSVYGTRPEAIKMAPLVMALERRTAVEHRVCQTGQHREMLEQVNQLFSISPQFKLNVMQPGASLNELMSKILVALNEVFLQYKPDMILVHGDTTTTLSASIAAFHQGIPIGHIEAGLRTNNLYSPWPEEGNRRLTGQLATLNFAPTLSSKENLIRDNIDADSIYVTGNTVIDSLMWMQKRIVENDIKNSEIDQFSFMTSQNKVVLITGHRRENFGEGFKEICAAISALAIRNPKINFVYPVHLNPNVQGPVKAMLSNHENIHLIDPLDYLNFTKLMMKSHLILTDSGGIQEEAPSLGKPVLLMRDTTERPEGVLAGTVKLVGTSANTIIEETQKLLSDEKEYRNMSEKTNPFGDGKASERICDAIEAFGESKKLNEY